jgi:hypothetical protein
LNLFARIRVQWTDDATEGETMLSTNHVITAGILAFLLAFSPMSIGMYYGDTAPSVSTVSFKAN